MQFYKQNCFTENGVWKSWKQ